MRSNELSTRFIPTGVGNTTVRDVLILLFSVHPHGRGEHCFNCFNTHRLAGSSPRAWGTRIRPCSFQAGDRFIPTGVGNTLLIAIRRAIRAVHPHGRGEHDFVRDLFHVDFRFIPTGVGNTQVVKGYMRLSSVHPHGRGEHVLFRAVFLRLAGSSPRAWGTH